MVLKLRHEARMNRLRILFKRKSGTLKLVFQKELFYP